MHSNRSLTIQRKLIKKHHNTLKQIFSKEFSLLNTIESNLSFRIKMGWSFTKNWWKKEEVGIREKTNSEGSRIRNGANTWQYAGR